MFLVHMNFHARLKLVIWRDSKSFFWEKFLDQQIIKTVWFRSYVSVWKVWQWRRSYRITGSSQHTKTELNKFLLQGPEDPKPSYSFEMTTSFFMIDNNGYLIVNVDNLDRDPPSPGTFRFQVLITQHSSYNVITLPYDKRLRKDTMYANTFTLYCHCSFLV